MYAEYTQLQLTFLALHSWIFVLVLKNQSCKAFINWFSLLFQSILGCVYNKQGACALPTHYLGHGMRILT